MLNIMTKAEGSAPSPHLTSLPLTSSDTAKPVEPANSNHTQSVWKRLRQLVAPSEGTLKEALEEVLEDIDEGEVDASDEERSMLSNMLNFASLTVSDVMVPRSNIIAFEAAMTLEELRDKVKLHRHSRFPVYEDSLDTVAGYIHMKDVIPYLGDDAPAYDVRKILRPIIFAAPSMRVTDLLVQMRQSTCHIAVVVDEYGGTDGLITMEDVCEELVGDIQDEHYEEEYHLERINEHTIVADARVPVEELSMAMQMSLLDAKNDDVDTVSGLIISLLGRIPARGEIVMLSAGIKAEILNADPRRIQKVRIVQEHHAPSAMHATG